jgi:NAD+ synthetase
MKICLGQINTTPGDFDGNFQAIRTGVEYADQAGCDAVLFPELCIPGYLSQDLLYHAAFIDRNLEVLDEVRRMTASCNERLHVVVGYVERNRGPGKPFFNSAAVLRRGEIVGTYAKQLIPFYDVFDELRYFEPGEDLLILDIAGSRTGIAICEDLWNDKGSDDYNYEENPFSRYRDEGVDVVFSINSSPYVRDKCWQRLKTIAPGTEPGMTVAYVHQVGGQDELVFNGHSFVARNGNLIHLSEEVFENSYDVVDTDADKVMIEHVYEPARRVDVGGMSASLYDLLVLGLRDYVQKSGFSQVVLASSGGVDSAVVCRIACDAVGPGNVHAIRLPSIFSTDHSRDDAVSLHVSLGCWDYEVPVKHEELVGMLNEHYRQHGDNPRNLVTEVIANGRYANVADENMQARLRDLFVMHFSNAYGAMPLSTGNKTESACGYYTHFDMNFSYAPIKDLYKFQVLEIARNAHGIPGNIWRKPPSAELAPGQTDEASLLPYPVLDPIVRAYVEDYVANPEGFLRWVSTCRETGEAISGDLDVLDAWLSSATMEADFSRILGLIGRMEYKRRQTCPGTKVSKVAFGIGRRIPIVEKWSS